MDTGGQTKRLAFRIEGSDGLGPWSTHTRFGYTWCLPAEWRSDAARSAGEMPGTHSDSHMGGDRRIHNRHYAFPSIERLRYWFCPTTLAFANMLGARLRVFETDSYALYANQIVFDLEKARLVGTYSLTRMMGAPWHDTAWG